MAADLPIKYGVTIPAHELIITASRAGGPGGQHVNTTSTRITVKWNVAETTALTQEQKERILKKLASRLTSEGEIMIHNSSSRSQLHNKKAALQELAELIRKALQVPKKRLKTKISQAAKEARLKEKKMRSTIKKMRSKKIDE